MGAAIGGIGLDLLQSAAGQKRRSRADERDQADVGEAGTDADEVLFSDSDVDHPIGELLTEGDQVARADRVVAHGNDSPVSACQRNELVPECLPAVVRRGFDETSGHADNSLMAWSICSRLGTLWCHSTRSSMNETPLPFMVLAITHTGRPLAEGPNATNNCL